MKTRGRPRHPDVLTPREWEALTLVREGLTNPQIAERMGITLDAAKYHVSEILSKLELRSREEAAAWRPEPARAAVLRPSWANALGRWWPLIARIAGAGVVVAAVAGLGVLVYGVIKSDGEDEPSVEAAPSATAAPTVPLSEAEITLLNGFIEARVAGEGAQQYLNFPEQDIPLLYATTSGAPYERAEFEPVSGIEWPYGFWAFKVRLFAGDTVVEQLVFMPHDRPEHFAADGRLRIEYQPDGFGAEIAPTAEDGQPLKPHYAFDGEVTLYFSYPWVSFGRGLESIMLVPEGAGPTTDGGQRNGWDRLVLMADPARTGTNCPTPTNAEALAESIQSDPNLEATAPVAVGVRGAEGLMMDVRVVAGASGVCGGLSGVGDLFPRASVHLSTKGRVRLYLFDAPEGSSMRILAIVINVPESRFERAAEAAAPVVEFNVP